MRRYGWIWLWVVAVGAAGCDNDTKEVDQSGGEADAGPNSEGNCGPPSGGPAIDPSFLPACPEEMCASGGRCVPNSFLPPGATGMLGPCDGNSTCVPDKFVAAGGEVVPQSCRSVADAEGRCISRCVPAVAEQSDLLPQDVCDDDELCVPCFDPRTGESTGACTLSCDMPTEDPVSFPECCEGIGRCVPEQSVPEDFRDQLPEDSCEASGSLCAPVKFVAEPDYTPPSCTPALAVDIPGLDLGEHGACIARCVAIHGNPLAEVLGQSSCDPGEVCAPCTDPFGEPTGVCDL
jgi:hypothetical protein